ncbi:transcriptional regulator [Streptomyces lunaelactis]|uniref:Transcriptional regulator n=1 Tax=Streptomyces lunaelactis TaxID=1535768 RepID=A0A2R4T7A6_9ACTN|nr:helix-turn-helix transcriptional regulator [Streptomyces lunaelactis]AVZ74977.1 transcriptional regulator [Streptomyces lunaelactis]NUK85239.1 helix-turn-helix transcriptional regulator [Streptomyces lunaelactis]
MPFPDEEHTGTRIAHHRKRTGLTQRGLAQRIPYSYSLLTQVESGHKPASPDLVAAVAKALCIDVTALTGQPYVTELQQDRLAELIRPIREALDLYDLGADPEITPRPADQLRTSADHLCAQIRATKLYDAALELPAAIAEITTAAHRTPSSQLWATLASTYRTAHDVSVKLGYYDLSTVALDRMDWAAARASDPLLGAVRQYMRALVYFREGEYSIGRRLISSGHGILEQAPPTHERHAVTGQLHLGASIIAARASDEHAVATHLAEAGSYADQVGEAKDVHWLSFGPTNVAVHAVSAHVEMRQYGKALRYAAELEIPDDWAVSRAAHFHVDQARAQMEAGRTEAALKSIVRARRLAPQQTRYHSGARETIRGLVHVSRRTPDTLDHLAAWVGL